MLHQEEKELNLKRYVSMAEKINDTPKNWHMASDYKTTIPKIQINTPHTEADEHLEDYGREIKESQERLAMIK